MKKRNISKEDRLNRDINDLRKRYLSEPTRLFHKKDRVSFGNHDETYIKDIIDTGKIYSVHVKNTLKRHGEVEIEEKDMIVPWYNLYPYRTPDQFGDRISKNPEYLFQFMQQDIRSLFIYWYQFGIDTEVDYQRPLVWTSKDKISLLNSIYENIEIGKFAIVFKGYETEGKLYEMLDGKQRLNALIDFYEDRYRWRGKYFSQLHPRDQNHFENFSISVAVTTQPISKMKKYEYFLKLNTQGKPQNKLHLKKVFDLYNQSLGTHNE